VTLGATDSKRVKHANVSVLGQSGLFSKWAVSTGVSREQELHNVATGEERGLLNIDVTNSYQ
jgi:hypothetical protein